MTVATMIGCVSPMPSMPVKVYRPSEVVRDAAAFEGKAISMSGYLILEDEARAFWDSEDDADEVVRRGASGGDPIWNRCITAYFDRKTVRSLSIPTKANIEVIGTVGVTNRDKDGVDLWACNDVYITVHQLIRK
jgi:hypothetical protein